MFFPFAVMDFYRPIFTVSLTLAQGKLLPPMNSHTINRTSDENEPRGTKRPRNNKKLQQVSYRHLDFIRRQIRRVSEQTSPQVARAAGHTRQAGRRRRIDQWQLDQFSVFISKTGEEFSAIRAQIQGRGQQWHVGSEVKATIRSIRRGGCLYQPLFAV